MSGKIWRYSRKSATLSRSNFVYIIPIYRTPFNCNKITLLRMSKKSISVTIVQVKFLIPTLYPAISPIIQFCSLARQRERFNFRMCATSFFKQLPSVNNHQNDVKNGVKSRRITGVSNLFTPSRTLPEEQTYLSPHLEMTRIKR